MSGPVLAQDERTAFQFSIFNPAQLFPSEYTVDGLRINLIYGSSAEIKGLDFGLVNMTQGDEHGFQLGAVNLVAKDFGGIQLGLFNREERYFKGLQLAGLANIVKLSGQGVQAAVFYNDAQQDMRGLQLGLVNHAGSLDGVQLGLLNFNDDTRHLGFFPFVNAAF